MKHSNPRRLEFTTPRCGATWVVRFYLLWRRYSSGSSCVGRADLKMRLEWIPVIYVNICSILHQCATTSTTVDDFYLFCCIWVS